MSTPPENERTLITPRDVSAAPVPAASSAAASSAGDSGNALPIGTYLAEFELTGVIGEGGFGIVYNAWDHSLQRRVALKEYMPASLALRHSAQVQVRSQRHRETFDAGLKSFINEARLLAQFDHPSLVKVYRFWEANGTAYMVMPLYQGVTLKDKLRALNSSGGTPDESWLMGMLAPLTEALAVIHAENCFHRDIAPDNVILLDGSERPLLLDFGAARRVIGDMTQALTVILKPGFAPVEQYAETPHMKQGAWTDVYALAASVHYAILGRTPPPSVSRLMSDHFVPLSVSAAGRYSERFLQAMDKALRVRPEERTQNIATLRADLGLVPPDANDQTTRMKTAVAAQPSTPADAPGVAYDPTVVMKRGAPADDDTKTHDVAQARPVASAAAPIAAAVAPVAPVASAATPRSTPKSTPSKAPTTAPTAASRSGLWLGLGLGAVVLVGVGGYMALAEKKSAVPASTAPSPSARPAADPLPAITGANPSTPAATTPPPAALPTPTPPREFDVQAEFDKVMSAQTPGYIVSATPAKGQLRIGRDNPSFSVTSSRDGFVHVLLLGPDQSLLLLYPNAAAKDHRIKAGQRLTLPQPSWPLVAAEPPGPEHFLVIVSNSPRSYAALVQGDEYIFKKLPTGATAADIAARAASSLPLLLGLAAKDCVADCDVFGAALFSLEVTR